VLPSLLAYFQLFVELREVFILFKNISTDQHAPQKLEEWVSTYFLYVYFFFFTFCLVLFSFLQSLKNDINFPRTNGTTLTPY
jgi:hypothetical protein